MHDNSGVANQSGMNMMASASVGGAEPPCPANCGPFPNYCFEITNTPKRLISFLWIVTNILGFCYIFCAIAVAAANDCDGDGCSRALGFYGVWDMFLVLILAVGGTLVMRMYQTAMAIGFFLGVTAVMACNMFLLLVLFAGDDGKGSADNAAATFSFFLCISYSAFAISLAKYRDHVIKKAYDEDAPPAKLNETGEVSHSTPGSAHPISV